MRFSSVKIEKLLGLPEIVLPNQFYLIEEVDGTVKFYISDTKSQLHLLNEGVVLEVNIEKTEPYGIPVAENYAVYHNLNAASTVPFVLPEAVPGLQYTFVNLTGAGMRVATTFGERIFIGDVSTGANQMIYSDAEGSVVCLRVVGNDWIARYLTGQWNTLALGILTMHGEPVIINGDALYI